MRIITSDKNIKLKYGNGTFTHPLNTVSYAVNEDATGITLFRNNEAIGTSPIGEVSVNGEALTVNNIDLLLGDLFVLNSGNGGITLPITIADVNGLQAQLDNIATTITLSQSEYDALTTKDPNTFYYVY